jgi:hypothetical protein
MLYTSITCRASEMFKQSVMFYVLMCELQPNVSVIISIDEIDEHENTITVILVYNFKESANRLIH